MLGTSTMNEPKNPTATTFLERINQLESRAASLESVVSEIMDHLTQITIVLGITLPHGGPRERPR